MALVRIDEATIWSSVLDSEQEVGLTPLSAVPVGSEVVVRRIESPEHLPGESGITTRLERVGFIAGTRVMVERRAPLGDPTVYELRGYRLGLRSEAAALIKVQVIDDTGATS